jgi:hypothetical protein
MLRGKQTWANGFSVVIELSTQMKVERQWARHVVYKCLVLSVFHLVLHFLLAYPRMMFAPAMLVRFFWIILTYVLFGSNLFLKKVRGFQTDHFLAQFLRNLRV